MCEIFPEVKDCCLCLSLRLGMLFISVFAIMSGVIGLSSIVQRSDVHYDDMYNISDIKNPEEVAEKSTDFVQSAIGISSCCFMFTGVLLFFGTLFNSEGFVQGFVWLTFLNIILGYIIVLMISVECVAKITCFLSPMDWLSGSILLVICVLYMTLWIYFISVANSSVIAGDVK